MRVLKLQPWRKITELTGGKGVAAEWQGFPDDLLQITSERASAIPCGSSSGCYMNVIEHGSSDLVGICTSEPRRCDKRVLTKLEAAVYHLNHPKLFKCIAEALGFTELPEKVDGMSNCHVIGHLNPQAELKFPVFIFLGQTSSQADKAVNTLCMSQNTPFLLLLPFGSMASNASLDATNKCKAKIIGLDDIFEVIANGKVQSKESIDGIINNWLEPILPKSAKPGSEYKFPTPAGAEWEQFVFEFTATEMLLVTCGKIQARLEPEHLRMKNQNSGKRTLQWSLLLSLAKTGGALSWQDDSAHDRIKKQKQTLMKKLQDTFQITSDPIPWDDKDKSNKCYRCRFTIKAADNVLRQLP